MASPHQVQSLADFDFSQVALAFFSASNEISATYAPIAAKAGAIVIDKSSFFRNDPAIPLIVPEVNAAQLSADLSQNIIASPNCSTIPIVMALKPLHDAVGIVRVNIATYQSVSGSGKAGIEGLWDQTGAVLANQPVPSSVYAEQIAFNVLPLIDALEANGYTRVRNETRG